MIKEEVWQKLFFKYQGVFDDMDIYVPIGRDDLGTSKINSALMDMINEIRVMVEPNATQEPKFTVEKCYGDIYKTMFKICLDNGQDEKVASLVATQRAVRYAWAVYINTKKLARHNIFEGQ